MQPSDQQYPHLSIDFSPAIRAGSLCVATFGTPLILNKESGMDKPAEYQITVEGVVPESMQDRLGGMQLLAGSLKKTILTGWLPDQAALKGVLDTLYYLRLPIVAVVRL